MKISFPIYAICVFCALLWAANFFAAPASEPPPNDLSAPSPATPPSLFPILPPTDNHDFLMLVRLANDEVYSSLQSFVCKEEIHRFKARLTGEAKRQIDCVTARVSFENGVEHYTNILQNQRERASMASIAGAWSTGEFGTLLRQTQDLLKTQPVLFRTNADLDGTPASVYAVEISSRESPWDLEIRVDHYHIAFRTEVWVSRASGEILKIERVSTGIPSEIGISEIRWGVTLQPIELNGRTWLLPKTGDYTVLYQQSGRREWNDMTFSQYQRYGSEVALKFR